MTLLDDTWPATRFEDHCGDRVVRCFSERPASLYAMLLDAVQRNPDGDAIVCGDSRLSDYKVPESFTLTTEPLLRNANGKLMKRAMRDHVIALFTTS